MRFYIAFVFLSVFLLTCPVFVSASSITVAPLLIDETLEPREIVTRTITLRNNFSDRKLVVFATVNEIAIDNSGSIKEFISPVMTDRTNTVTSWVEISRGRIEIDPGQTTDVPMTLRIHPYAVPGEYHVFLGFIPESNRPAAEAVAMRGDADGVIAKVTISETKKAGLRLSGFLIDRFVVDKSDGTFTVKLENTGELETVPSGEVIIYNTTGEEVGAIPFNSSGQAVPPGGEVIFTEQLPETLALGRLKATLAIAYGENQTASLSNTTFFYSLPLPLLLAIAGGLLVAVLLITLLLRRMLDEEHDDTVAKEVLLRVRDTHDAKPTEHDIDLTNTK